MHTAKGELMARLFSIRPTLTFKGRQFKGIRGFAGKPSHPPLTDFPVTCYILLATFDLISLLSEDGSKAARDFFTAGTGLTILSLIIGGLVGFGAAYGGALVYEYGFNVETSGDHPVWHESETDVFPGEDQAVETKDG